VLKQLSLGGKIITLAISLIAFVAGSTLLFVIFLKNDLALLTDSIFLIGYSFVGICFFSILIFHLVLFCCRIKVPFLFSKKESLIMV